MKNSQSFETLVSQNQGYVQNTTTSLTNISQKIHDLEQKYRLGLRFHIYEAWAADKNEDKRHLKKLSKLNENIVFIKAKINISAMAVGTAIKKNRISVSEAIAAVFKMDGPISGFTLVEVETEGDFYAKVILAMHVSTFANFNNAFKFIKQSQKKLIEHKITRDSTNKSRSSGVVLEFMENAIYATLIEKIQQAELDLAQMRLQKRELESKLSKTINTASNSKKVNIWPLHERDFNELLKYKKKLPLKNMHFGLYEKN